MAERAIGVRAVGRLARRALTVGLLAFGWLFLLAGAAAADEGVKVDLPGLIKTVDQSLRSLAGTAEDVPSTVHHVIAPIRDVASPHVVRRDTPRVLGRPGRAATGHRVEADSASPKSAVRQVPVRHVQSARAAAKKPVRAVHANQRIRLEQYHERVPVPYAPKAPESLTVGSAAQSSGAAGPAVHLPHCGDLNAPRPARDEATHRAPSRVPAPVGLPACTPD